MSDGSNLKNLSIAVSTAALVISTSCLAWQSVPRETQTSQSFGERLSAKIPVFESDHQPLAAALLKVVYRYHLPLGLEYIDRDAVQRPLELKLRNSSVREVLESLVGQMPEYRVRFGSGVVEVYSPKARQDRANLLNTVIGNFDLQKDTIRMASAELRDSLANELQPGAGSIGDVVDSFLSPKFSLHVRAAPVYEILNALVAADGRTLWAVAAPPNRLSVLQPAVPLWKLYDLDFPNWEALARHDLLGMFPSKQEYRRLPSR